MSLFDIPLNRITAADIEALVDNQVPEGNHLDYKRKFPDLENKDAKLEFLKDVCAFANAVGGDLVYGIDEGKGAAPHTLRGIEIANFDERARQIHQIIRSNTEPPVSGVDIRAIGILDGKSVLIVRVLKSWRPPHRRSGDGARFFVRRGPMNGEMEMDEVRNAFLRSASLADRFRAFRESRSESILRGETPVPINNQEGVKDRVVVHVIPDRSFDLGRTVDVRAIVASESWSMLVSPLWGNSELRFNIDGVLVYHSPPHCAGHAYSQCFRNGVIENVDQMAYRIPDRDEPPFFPGGDDSLLTVDELIIARTITSMEVLRNLNVGGPWIVSVSLLGAKGYWIKPYTDTQIDKVRGALQNRAIDRDVIHLPELTIESFSEFEAERDMQPMLDALWNASGLPCSLFMQSRREMRRTEQEPPPLRRKQ